MYEFSCLDEHEASRETQRGLLVIPRVSLKEPNDMAFGIAEHGNAPAAGHFPRLDDAATA